MVAVFVVVSASGRGSGSSGRSIRRRRRRGGGGGAGAGAGSGSSNRSTSSTSLVLVLYSAKSTIMRTVGTTSAISKEPLLRLLFSSMQLLVCLDLIENGTSNTVRSSSF